LVAQSGRATSIPGASISVESVSTNFCDPTHSQIAPLPSVRSVICRMATWLPLHPGPVHFAVAASPLARFVLTTPVDLDGAGRPERPAWSQCSPVTSTPTPPRLRPLETPSRQRPSTSVAPDPPPIVWHREPTRGAPAPLAEHPTGILPTADLAASQPRQSRCCTSGCLGQAVLASPPHR